MNRRSTAFLNSAGVGWSWWTHKKLARETQPWLCPATRRFQRILDYWMGRSERPPRELAREWLFEQARRTHTSYCDFLAEMVRSLEPFSPDAYLASLPVTVPEIYEHPMAANVTVQLRAVRGREGVEVERGEAGEGIRAGQAETEGGYAVEMAVAWKALGGRGEGFLGLDVHVNDNDKDRREDKLAWWAFDDEAHLKPSIFGTARLQNTPDSSDLSHFDDLRDQQRRRPSVGDSVHPTPFMHFLHIETRFPPRFSDLRKGDPTNAQELRDRPSSCLASNLRKIQVSREIG